MVEPAQELIVHEDVTPKWFCRCETPDGMQWHELDERECPACGANLWRSERRPPARLEGVADPIR